MKSKSNNSKNKPPIMPKSVIEILVDQRTRVKHYLNEQGIEDLAQFIVDKAQAEDVYTISQIRNVLGLYPNEYFRLIGKYPVLKEAHSYAMDILNSKRHVGALTNKLNASIVAVSMPLYDEEWKDMLKWKSDLSTKQLQANQGFVIQMAPIPSSDMVPPKKEDNGAD